LAGAASRQSAGSSAFGKRDQAHCADPRVNNPAFLADRAYVQ